MMLYTQNDLQIVFKQKVSALGVTNVVIDSRKVVQGSLFFGLIGATNGGDYAAKALEMGAELVVANYRAVEDERIIVVPDPLLALQDLARFARKRTTATVVAVTGSVGKTTTKEMLACALSPAYASMGNYNNHIGMPLTLVNAPLDAQVIILEMGMSAAGEIAFLSKIAKPHIGIITTVGPAHLEFFASVEAIAEAKAEIFVGMNDQGVAILNRDNQYYDIMLNAASHLQVYTFGKHEEADMRLIAYDQDTLLATYQYKDTACFTLSLQIVGEHHALNAAAVLLLDYILPKFSHAAQALPLFTAQNGRGDNFIHYTGVLVIDESYNASPLAVKSTLKTFAARKQKHKCVVLADMLELGEGAAMLHHDLLPNILEVEADLYILLGPLMSSLQTELEKYGNVIIAETLNEVYCAVLNYCKHHLYDSVVLLKGSKSTGLYQVSERLKLEK